MVLNLNHIFKNHQFNHVLEVRKTEAKMKLSALENPTFTFNLTRIRVVTYQIAM